MKLSTLIKPVILSTALALPMLAACSVKEPFDWKEEILLHDGRKVIAERVDTYGGPREPSQTEPNTKERTIKFADPSDPKKTYSHKITGTSNYLMLDFYQGKPWLVVFVGPFSTDTRCPIGTYDTYAWDGQKWVPSSFKARPKEFVKPNMTVSYMAETRTKGKLTDSTQISKELNFSKRHGAALASWQFIDMGGNGRQTDCDHYRKLAEGKKP
jgi:hypothetical protein